MIDRARFLSAATSAFASIAFIRSPAKAADFEYKFGTNVPINDFRSSDAVTMADRIRAQSNGRVDIKIYPGGVLGSDTSMLTQVRSGALEFFTVSPGILGNVVEVCGIEGVPFAFKDVATAFAAYDGRLGAYVRSEIEAKGITCMPKFLDNGFRQITNNVKPIKTVDDLAGLRMRVAPEALKVDLFKTFGTQVVALNFSELYTALQTHIVDGEENSYSIIEIGKIYEVQKYLSITNHMWGGYVIIANTDSWKALGPDLQAIVERNMNEYALQQRRDNAAFNNALVDKIRRRGMVVNTAAVASFKAKLADFYPRWKSNFGTKAWDLLESYTGKLG